MMCKKEKQNKKNPMKNNQKMELSSKKIKGERQIWRKSPWQLLDLFFAKTETKKVEKIPKIERNFFLFV